ncbi:TPM domain-containing protein [bacterium]|nr:TPM domain-containing protein [bacterium]
MKRKEVPRLFFNEEEKKRIISAVEDAEKKTAAEIVVRLEKNCPGDPVERCRELLQSLRITSTRGRTGVIILISFQDHKAAVFGDQAIDQVIGQEGWRNICDQLLKGFKEGKPCDALCEAIQSLAEKLSANFPYTPEDINELPNEPSF